MNNVKLVFISVLLFGSVQAQTSCDLELTGIIDFYSPNAGYFYHPPRDLTTDIFFSGKVVNSGVEAATDVFIEITVYKFDGLWVPIYSDSSEIVPVVYSDDTVLLNFSDVFTDVMASLLFYENSSYRVEYEVISDSLDAYAGDNFDTRYFDFQNTDIWGPKISRWYEHKSNIAVHNLPDFTDGNYVGFSLELTFPDTLIGVSVFVESVSDNVYLVPCLLVKVGTEFYPQATGAAYELTSAISNEWVCLPFIDNTGSDMLLIDGLESKIVVQCFLNGGILTIGADENEFHNYETQCQISYGTDTNYWYSIEKVPLIEVSLDCDVSVTEKTASDCHIYPNPTSGIINIDGKNIMKVEVINIQGQKIYFNSSHKNQTSELISIDLSGYSKGLYFLKVNTSNGIVLSKVVVE